MANHPVLEFRRAAQSAASSMLLVCRDRMIRREAYSCPPSPNPSSDNITIQPATNSKGKEIKKSLEIREIELVDHIVLHQSTASQPDRAGNGYFHQAVFAEFEA